jgi:L-iditol 2-dehydrogenase
VADTFRYANTYPAANALVAGGCIELDPLVTGRFGLNQVEAALTVGSTGEGTMKAIAYPQQSDV